MHEPNLVEIIVSVVGGGTIVPLIYKIYLRFANKDLDGKESEARTESIATTAAHEAVDAMSGVIGVLREQLKDGGEENKKLRDQRKEDREEIAKLRERIDVLTCALIADNKIVPELEG